MNGWLSIWGGGFGLPESVALAAVAAIGYLYGRSRSDARGHAVEPPDELLRAAEIARQLEQVAAALRGQLATHRAEVERFKSEVRRTGDDRSNENWTALREEAERVLAPTLRLVGQLATAYDQIRQQSMALSNFSGGRTDPLTGLCNRRGLNELLEVELSGHAASRSDFSIAILGLHGRAEDQAAGQTRLVQAAELLRPQLRDRDVIARYGLDELVVVMPSTRLYGACVLGRRVRERFVEEAGLVVSAGMSQSLPGDTPESLLARADSALYSAKATGDGGAQFLHTGQAIRADTPPAEAAPAPEAPQPISAGVADEPNDSPPVLRLTNGEAV